MNLTQSEMFYDYLQSYLMDKNSLEYNIIKIIKKHHIEMSDLSLVDFLLRLSITMMRILTDHCITFSHDLKIIEGRSEFKCANDIASTISKAIKKSVNEHEVNNIAIQLICLRSSKGVSLNVYTRHINYDIHELIDRIFDEIYQQTLLHFNDKHFNYTFQHYVESSLIRLYYNEKVRTPIYNTIQSNYPLAYELAQITSNVIYEYEHKYITSSEIAFFSILFQDAITKQRSSKKRVLLLTGLGGGHATLCRNLLLEHFENKIDIIKTFQFYKLEDEDLSQYDFIISTTSIHQKLAIPYINISQIITDNDYNKIKNYLSFTLDHYRLETLFHPKLFSSNVEAHRKTDVVNEIYRLLNGQYPTIKESFVKTLSSKDTISTTYYANNIALLKLKKPLNSNNIVVVVILKEPLMFIDQ
ncbi:MAG: PRD domain-containing protein [Erysipelotrichaceae bacterium]|nr:PRD domain-containing protein [Erysipelotrichaceae bacterium]